MLMPLNNLESWRQAAPTHYLDLIRNGEPPAGWRDCRNTPWEEVFEFYCRENYCDENLRFLWAVVDYQAVPSVVQAEEIIETIVYGDPPVNLYDTSTTPIDEWYRDEDHLLDVSLFDKAFAEVNDSFTGTYMNFTSAVGKTLQEMVEDEQRESEISEPELQEFDISKVDMAVVDNWNQQALKELGEGDQTPFCQYEDLVLIKHPSGSAVQPYWTWASTQDWAVAGAYVLMEKKGGVFDAGRIKAVGVRPGMTNYFEAAIARISKKKVVY